MAKNSSYLTTCLALSVSVFGLVNTASAIEGSSINTLSIMASSASPSCLDYKVKGMCFWLKCSWRGCRVRSSVKVKHFIPEMVVSAYNHKGQSPWTEVRALNFGAVGGGRNQTPNKNYTQFRFKNAEAFGHPGGAVFQLAGGLGFACQSQTTPYKPYFLSALDFLAWNYGMPEMFYPEALTPLMREVRANGDTWGNIYPRSGSVTQTHDYKASAVIAQRVADIVTRSGQLHLYFSAAAEDNKNDGKWYPKPVQEGDPANHKWQMLSPKISNTCAIFPDGGAVDSYGDKLSNTENYSWALWRPYSCCKKMGQKFLWATEW